MSQAIKENSDYYGEDDEATLLEYKYRFSENSARGCIERIFNASSHNKISYVKNTKTYENGYELEFVTFYIYTTDIDTIVRCFHEAGFTSMTKNSTDYPYVKISEEEIEVDENIDLEEGETVEYGGQQLNKEQYKIAIWLEKRYKGLTQPYIAFWVVNNEWNEDYTEGKYITKVERDSDGNITNVELNLATIQIPELGDISGAFKEIADAQDDEDSADLGGILLSPVFWLINFIADAIESNLGNIMTGKGLTVTGGTKLLQASAIPHSGDSEPITVSTKSFLLGSIQYPNIKYTPEEIFAGKIDLLSIDFISGKNYQGEQNKDSGWNNVRKVISQWYQVLRMIAIIGLLSVLIYTGIKIIISANAKDKAKYKEWIINWLMAVAILFFMHYIMAFIISVTGEFSKLVAEASQTINVNPSPNGDPFSTNLMGLVRFMIQSENFYIKVGYEVMYIALIVYTIKFTFVYLKRVLNMAFLTLIAPIVALTYPIDKINDGKAQGFDMWLKEYIFNALLQPMHQIMYYVLVGSAVSIAAKNPIYGIVVLAFMAEAEKLLKKIFGFDKAGGGTVGGMANAFAAGAIASNIAKMAKLPKGNAGKGGKDNSDASNSLLDNFKPEKDGPIEDSFASNLLDDGSQTTGDSASGNSASGNSASGSPTSTSPASGSPTSASPASEGPASEGPTNRGPANGNPSADSGEPIKEKSTRMQAIGRGTKNVLKTLAKPVYDIDRRGTGYNSRRWKRRVINGIKGAGKLTVGAALGTAAAAVQAGISITDGKYNPMEGVASFAAGYAGGRGMVSKIGGSLSNSFMEGYYEGDQAALKKRLQEQYMDNDENHRAFKRKYGDDANEMQQLACDYMVPFGIKKPNEQFEVQKMANEIVKRNSDYANYSDAQKKEYMEKAIKQARNTKRFREQPGVEKIIHKPNDQKQFIDAEIRSRGITDMNSDEAKKIRTGLENAFKSAIVWDTVNKS